MHHINSAIEKYGARLHLGPDLERPWTVAFIAVLNYRQGPAARASGRTPAEAIDELEDLLANSTTYAK
jgi:hypothetical protein